MVGWLNHRKEYIMIKIHGLSPVINTMFEQDYKNYIVESLHFETENSYDLILNDDAVTIETWYSKTTGDRGITVKCEQLPTYSISRIHYVYITIL